MEAFASRDDIYAALRAVFPADIAGLILPYTAHTDAEKIYARADSLEMAYYDFQKNMVYRLPEVLAWVEWAAIPVRYAQYGNGGIVILTNGSPDRIMMAVAGDMDGGGSCIDDVDEFVQMVRADAIFAANFGWMLDGW